MSCPFSKTITKTGAIVILSCLFGSFLAGCAKVSPGVAENATRESLQSGDYSKPVVTGTISSSEINESSGIAASGCNRGVFWTHNDSGGDAFIYALNEQGEKLATYKVAGAQNIDWEDIAAFRDERGACFLFIGDIGDNALQRPEHIIYRIAEPDIAKSDRGSSRKNPMATDAAEAIRFQYPDGRWDSGTLMVNSQTGDLYVLSKRLGDASVVYKLAAGYDSKKLNQLKKIAEFAVPAFHLGLLTGGDISPDGTRVVVCDYFNAYELVLPANATGFDEIWQQQPTVVELGERKQGEAVAFGIDGRSIFATSVKTSSPLIEVKRR